ILVLFVFPLGLLPVLLVLFAAGAFAAFQLAANAAFVAAAPPERRSEAFGLAQGGMSLGQGVFMVLAGAAVSLGPPHLVIAAFGAAGTLAALLILADRARTRGPVRGASPTHPTPPHCPHRPRARTGWAAESANTTDSAPQPPGNRRRRPAPAPVAGSSA